MFRLDVSHLQAPTISDSVNTLPLRHVSPTCMSFAGNVVPVCAKAVCSLQCKLGDAGVPAQLCVSQHTELQNLSN